MFVPETLNIIIIIIIFIRKHIILSICFEQTKEMRSELVMLVRAQSCCMIFTIFSLAQRLSVLLRFRFGFRWHAHMFRKMISKFILAKETMLRDKWATIGVWLLDHYRVTLPFRLFNFTHESNTRDRRAAAAASVSIFSV